MDTESPSSNQEIREKGMSDLILNLDGVWRRALLLLSVLWGAWVMILPMEIFWDYGRALAFAMGTELIIVNFLINYSYRDASKKTTGEAKNMPKHIRWVAASFLLCVVAILGAVYELLGEPPKWYGLPIGLLAFAVGLIALGYMFRFAVVKRAAEIEAAKTRA